MSETRAEAFTQDSLQHAFDSLDRASEASRHKSARHSQEVVQSSRLPFDGASSDHSTEHVYSPHRANRLAYGRASFKWQAQPRQHVIDTRHYADRRPLAGGITVEEMRQRVQERQQSKHQQQLQQGALRDDAASTASAEPREATPAEELSAEHAGQPTLDGPIEQSGMQTQISIPRKRTLQWAAKRDRRIARRRRSPPRTRSRAANKEDGEEGQENAKAAIEEPRCLVDSSADGHAHTGGHSANTTDPSTGEGGLISTPEEQIVYEGVWTDQDTRNRPVIALSLTERAVGLISHPKTYSIETQPSSHTEPETEDEERSSEIAESSDVRRETRAVSQVEDESQTEDDDEPASAVPCSRAPPPMPRQQRRPKAPARPPPPARETDEHLARQAKPARLPRSTSTVVRAPKSTDRSAQRRPANKEARGRPIFEGLVFALTGFWSKVKLHGKLVEKHGGKLVVPSAPLSSGNPFDGITHFVICPHGTFLPDRERVESALQQWCAGRQDAVQLFRNQAQSMCLIDVRWISDCIENCLSKQDILPVDRYLIGI